MRVPGSRMSLLQAKALLAAMFVAISIHRLDAWTWRVKNKDRE